MDVASLTVGILGLAFALFTHLRSRRKEQVVRLHLAKMIVVIRTMETYAGWAVSHFRTVRHALDAKEWTDETRQSASDAVHSGSGDAMASNRYAHELLRDLRALQLATFGKTENLTTGGRMILITDRNGEREVNVDPGEIMRLAQNQDQGQPTQIPPPASNPSA